jgi:hypothetical protein
MLKHFTEKNLRRHERLVSKLGLARMAFVFLQYVAVVCLVSMWISVVGCGPSAETLAFQTAIAKTKANYRSADVRSVALSLYGRTDIPENAIPKTITSLPVFRSAAPADISGIVLNTNAIMFYTGSGFGHWGIVLCKNPLDETVPKSYGKKVTPWDQGIYFYRE